MRADAVWLNCAIINLTKVIDLACPLAPKTYLLSSSSFFVVTFAGVGQTKSVALSWGSLDHLLLIDHLLGFLFKYLAFVDFAIRHEVVLLILIFGLFPVVSFIALLLDTWLLLKVVLFVIVNFGALLSRSLVTLTLVRAQT
jgi:hypothetical protein